MVMKKENILIHATTIDEGEFKRMGFQLYGKIGHHHGVYVKGDQFYLCRVKEKSTETSYVILEIYERPRRSGLLEKMRENGL